MTKEQIIARINQDALFALGFAVDNNPVGINQALSVAGFKGALSPMDRQYAYSVLQSMLASGAKDKVIAIVSAVPYNNDAQNYTAGLKDYFLRTTPPDKMLRSLDFNGLLAGVGSGLSTYAAVNAASAAGSLAAQQAATNGQADEAAKVEAENAAKRKKMWYWIGGIAGGLLLIGIIWWAATRSTGEEKRINTLIKKIMSKTWQWIISILAVLGLGAGITFLLLWNKEKKKNAGSNVDAPASSTSTAAADTATVSTGTFQTSSPGTSGNQKPATTTDPTLQKMALKQYAN